jgi:hypothetical protein
MALEGWSEKRNYKLEPDRFRQGRGAGLADSFTDQPAKRRSKFSIARK